MSTKSSPVVQLTTANLMIGGVALLGWMAIIPLAIFNQLPPMPAALRNLDDATFLATLFVGPFCLVAGLGMGYQRPWGRWLALALGAVTGLLALAGVVLLLVGFLRVNAARHLVSLMLFAVYSGATFTILWKNPFAGEAGSPPASG